jgi:Uma2 family endonuclease
MPDLPNSAAFALAPDWVCETLSSSTARIDRGRKLRIYAREGVPHVWIVDPIEGLVEVFRLGGQVYAVTVHEAAAGTLVRLEPFEAIELDIARWFAD